MIESEFALEKFVESIIANTDDKDRSLIDFFINIESKTSIENLDKILSSPSSKLLKGIVVGAQISPSHLVMESKGKFSEICEIVENTFREAKAFNFTTTMGDISNSSRTFIEKMINADLIDKIETRNVIVDLSKSGTEGMDELIRVLYSESQWMRYKAQFTMILEVLHKSFKNNLR